MLGDLCMKFDVKNLIKENSQTHVQLHAHASTHTNAHTHTYYYLSDFMFSTLHCHERSFGHETDSGGMVNFVFR